MAIEVDTSQLREQLGEWTRRAFQQADMPELLTDQVRRVFARGGLPETRWRLTEDGDIAFRGTDWAQRFQTREEIQPRHARWEVGTRNRIAAIHHHGAPERGLPPRPMIDFADRVIQQEIKERIIQGFEE